MYRKAVASAYRNTTHYDKLVCVANVLQVGIIILEKSRVVTMGDPAIGAKVRYSLRPSIFSLFV